MVDRIARLLALAWLCAATCSATADDHAPPPLRIDPLVEQFMQGEAIVAARLSPDGKHIAAVAQIGRDHYVLLVDTATHAARLLSAPRQAVMERRGYPALSVRLEPFQASWIDGDRVAVNFSARHLEQSTRGAWYGEVVGLDGRTVRKLDHGEVRIQRDDAGKPTGWVLVNSLNPGRWYERVNIDTGETLPYDFDVPGSQLLDPIFDAHGDILAVRTMDTAFWTDTTRITAWYRPDTAKPWVKVDERSINDDPLLPVLVSRPGHLVVLARNGGNRRAVWDYDVERHVFGERLAADDHDDIEGASWEEGSGEVRGFRTSGMKPRHIWLDATMARLQAVVDEAVPGHVNELRRSGSGNVEVWSYSDIDFGQMAVLDPGTLELRKIFTANPQVDPARMQPMQVLSYPSFDGLSIPAYLTLPGHPAGPAPLIVLVHGGPIARNHWGWQEEVQMLAAHGYAVFQPQFRGSSGFGKDFESAGYKQFGLAMQDDVTAGVQALVDRRIADPRRICIVGTSYGGYAALWGVVKTPDLYKCGVSVAGPSDIEEEVTSSSAGSQSGAVLEIWSKTIGDPRLMRETWASVSPRRHADRIQAPLLLVHGEEDRIVPIEQGETMRDALIAQHKDVQWLAFEAEGHGVSLLVDRRIWYGAMLELFARTIGEGEPPLPPTDAMMASARALAEKNRQAVWLPHPAVPAAAAAASAP